MRWGNFLALCGAITTAFFGNLALAGFNGPSQSGLVPGTTVFVCSTVGGIAYSDGAVLRCGPAFTDSSGNISGISGNFNMNAGAMPAFATPPAIHTMSTDSVQNPIAQDSISVANQFIGRRANGTNASKLALINNDPITTVAARGYQGGGAYTTGNNASLIFSAAEAWTDATHLGTQEILSLTPTASGTIQVVRTCNTATCTFITALTAQSFTASSGGVTVPAAQAFTFLGRSKLGSNLNGTVLLVNNGGTSGFTLDGTTDGQLRLFARDGTTPGVYGSGTNIGVSCSGSPTASFASVNGIVTHC